MLTTRFDTALQLAADLHRHQTRKGNEVPYLAHLLAVAATVLEHGADEDTAIAALLHDAVEDQGGAATAELIRTRFGDRVAEMVLHCSDSVTADPGAKPPWRARKEVYVARLAEADAAVALIVGADKLHNLNATLRDVRREGAGTLRRFDNPDFLFWYFEAVADALAERHDLPLVKELGARVLELREALDIKNIESDGILYRGVDPDDPSEVWDYRRKCWVRHFQGPWRPGSGRVIDDDAAERLKTNNPAAEHYLNYDTPPWLPAADPAYVEQLARRFGVQLHGPDGVEEP